MAAEGYGRPASIYASKGWVFEFLRACYAAVRVTFGLSLDRWVWGPTDGDSGFVEVGMGPNVGIGSHGLWRFTTDRGLTSIGAQHGPGITSSAS